MINSRALFTVLIVLSLFTLLMIKLVNVQIVRSEELTYFAKRQQTKLETVPAEQGLIYDRNGELLVHNRNDVTIYIDLRMLTEKKKSEVALKFSETFGKSKKHYLNLLQQKGKTICIEKKVSSEKARLLSSYKLDALVITEDPTRVYQYGSLASHVLGYVNADYKGVNGIAKSFDDELDGVNGARLVERNALGDLITISEEETVLPIPGNNIYLTIDKNIQSILEEELREGLKTYKGLSAIGIIMNPNSGEILALANIEDYDPNFFWRYDDAKRRNRSVTDTYEPGSTLKAITLSVLFNENACYENEVVDVEDGSYKFLNTFIRDTHPADRLTVRGVLEESSNIGMAKLIQRLSDEKYYKYLRDFGFGNYTSITLPGETKGVLENPHKWSKLTKAFMSFGYGLSVTPVQLITAFSALVNGGILYKPQLVKQQADWRGRDIYNFAPLKIRQVISKETSNRIKKLLISTIENGTGYSAKSKVISIGGKTGTSKIAKDGGYSSGINSSFVGFFPAQNPKAVCLILVDSPELEKYGGKVAAPIFRNIAERIVKNNPGLFFEYEQPQDRKVDDADQNIPVVYSDNSNDQNKTRYSFSSNIEFTKDRMPDLRGKTIKEALSVLNEIGLKYSIKGTGIVNSQSIQPGSNLKQNTVCVLDCQPDEIEGANLY